LVAAASKLFSLKMRRFSPLRGNRDGRPKKQSPLRFGHFYCSAIKSNLS